MAQMNISNTLFNDDSSGVISYAEQLSDRLIKNYINTLREIDKTRLEEAGFPVDVDVFQKKLNEFFLKHWVDFQRFLKEEGVDPTTIDSWHEVQEFLKGLPDDEARWLQTKITSLETSIANIDNIDGGAYDISAANNVGGTYATFANLSAAIAAIPASNKKSGMTIRYINTDSNEYEIYEYTLQYSDTTEGNAAFINTGNWVKASGGSTFSTGEKVKNVGIDDEPTAGSDNLVKSGGVYEQYNIKSEISLNNSVEGYYITSSGTTRDAANSRSIAYFNVEGITKIKTVVPKTGNNYSAVFAFCDTNDATGFTAPTNIVVGTYPESVNYTQDIDLSVENPSGKKYIAITFTTADGNPHCYSLKDYVFKEDIDEINEDINEINNELDIIQDTIEPLNGNEISQDSLQSLKYIGSDYTILTSSSASVAFYDITGKHNLHVSIPKTGNEYSVAYAYANSTTQTNLYTPEVAIKGNSQAKSFIAPNSANYNYLVLCFIASSGNPHVSEPNELQTLGDRVDSMETTDDRIISSMAANKKSDVCDKVRPLKVLFIANSFAVQSTQYLPNLFEKFGYNVIIGISYLGGGTVAQYDSLKDSNTTTQYVKYDGTEWVYEGLQISNLSVYDPSHTYTTVSGNNHCKYDVNGGTNYVAYRCIQNTTGTFDPSCWVRATKSNTLIQKLEDENWDAVFFIQGSAYAGLYSSYEPYFTSLLSWLPKKIQSLGYRIGWFMPWAWTDEKISTEGGNHDGGTTNAEMYANICSATQSNITLHNSEINFFCPCGTAVENQLNYYTQSQIWADGQHTNTVGYYAATLVLFDRLANYFCKTGLNELSYSSGIGIGTEEAFNNAKTSALNAISTPYEMTIAN